eukprot:m.55041 g.55041  ORF g.55041 m.55041 type:complete len:373 (-) comp7736_c1_seq1:92-1210(-)
MMGVGGGVDAFSIPFVAVLFIVLSSCARSGGAIEWKYARVESGKEAGYAPSSTSCQSSFAAEVDTALSIGAKECIVPKKGEYGSVAVGDAINGKDGYIWYNKQEDVVQGLHPNSLLKKSGRCIVSDTYRFVFRHVLKSGGSTVNMLLRLAIGEALPEHKPGDPYPEKPGKLSFSKVPSDLRLVSCSNIHNLNSYFHFAFVRDPFDRVKSIYYFAKAFDAQNPRASRPTKKAYPTLDEFLGADNPRWCLSGATSLSLVHTSPQVHTLTNVDDKGDASLTVDLLCNLKKLNHCFLEQIIPTIRTMVKRSFPDNEYKQEKVIKKIDRLEEYFRTPAPASNKSTKKLFSSEEVARFRCLVYSGPYAQDYSAFFSTS